MTAPLGSVRFRGAVSSRSYVVMRRRGRLSYSQGTHSIHFRTLVTLRSAFGSCDGRTCPSRADTVRCQRDDKSGRGCIISLGRPPVRALPGPMPSARLLRAAIATPGGVGQQGIATNTCVHHRGTTTATLVAPSDKLLDSLRAVWCAACLVPVCLVKEDDCNRDRSAVLQSRQRAVGSGQWAPPTTDGKAVRRR